MNVKQLIEALADMPQDAMVVVDGYEGGVTEPDPPQLVHVRLNVNTEDWMGEHEIRKDGTVAVYLER